MHSLPSHPDADAFVQAALRDPADQTARLVFADWLEETGEVPNIAWACYIRLHAEMADHRACGTWRGGIEEEAASHAPYIRGTATTTCTQFVTQSRDLRQLLPLSRFTVSLADYGVPLAVIELMPESVARESLVLALLIERDCLLVAMADPDDTGRIQRLAFILNREIVAVRATENEIRGAIDYYYGHNETESVTEVLVIFPEDPAP